MDPGAQSDAKGEAGPRAPLVRALLGPALLATAAGALPALFAWARLDWSPALAAALGVSVASTLFAGLTWRARRRRRVASRPFPEAWRATLEEYVGYYRALEPGEQARFEREVAIFLDEQTVTGPRGAELEDELRVLVAASAVTLAFGRRGHRYPALRDVVVYEGAFDEDYAEHAGGDYAGMVHAQGPILFSARSLRRGFRGERDGDNVGYHEFAHVLDFEQGRADGVPSTLPWSAVEPWVRVMHAETAKIERNRSQLRQYAAKNEAEFFAVATEVFFERPAALERDHPELYALLVEAYGQDPGAGAR